MENKYFTGVGSRETPPDIMGKIEDISSQLCKQGYILRSGGANGSDFSFELGCDLVNGIKEIYLPWKNFNNNNSPFFYISPEALKLASEIHPAWQVLSHGSKKLHARNCYQVLGLDLNTPSNILICWTKDGKETGGTRTAIVLAKKHNIPVYNLAITQDLIKLFDIL